MLLICMVKWEKWVGYLAKFIWHASLGAVLGVFFGRVGRKLVRARHHSQQPPLFEQPFCPDVWGCWNRGFDCIGDSMLLAPWSPTLCYRSCFDLMLSGMIKSPDTTWRPALLRRAGRYRLRFLARFDFRHEAPAGEP